MTSAFASALDALFADPNTGRDAVYIADGGALDPAARAVALRLTPGQHLLAALQDRGHLVVA